MIKDIVILGADATRTESEPLPSKMKWIYFKLSATPPREWAEIFDAERAFPRHSMWREACVFGTHIKVHCTLEEVQRHLDDIKEDVRNTNGKYGAWITQQKQRQSAEAEERARDQQEVSDVLGNLKF